MLNEECPLISFGNKCKKKQSIYKSFLTQSLHRKFKSMYSVCTLAAILQNNLIITKNINDFDWRHISGAALLIASKVLECLLKVDKISAAIIKTTNQGEEGVINQNILD